MFNNVSFAVYKTDFFYMDIIAMESWCLLPNAIIFLKCVEIITNYFIIPISF